MKMWQKLKEKDPTYRRGYVIPVCIHCNVPCGLMHADEYVKRGDFVCGRCSTEGPKKTFSTDDLDFIAMRVMEQVEYMIKLKS